MSVSEEQNYTTESEVYAGDTDDSEEDPTFDVLEQTRSTFSKLSINNKSTQCSIKTDDDDDEVEEEVELVVPELDEKDQKSYEAIHKLIQEGKVDKLKVDQCKIYLKKHGLRMSGNKPILLQRIQEHIQILDGGGERKYPASSFVVNCKGDVCMGDIVMFKQNVYEMFSIASRSATGPPCGTRTVAGRIVKESYGAAKQQHTFTIEVLWSKGEKPFPPLHPLLIKGRNLYRIKTMRQKWEDEGERRKNLSEKHARGAAARSNRDARVMLKSKRAPNLKSKHCNDKRGGTSLQHPPQQERHELKENSFHVNDKGGPILQQGWHENKTLQKDKHFHVNDKRGPILQHPSHVQLQQGWNENKNFHGNYKRGPTMQHPPPVNLHQERHSYANQPKGNCFHRNGYFPENGQRRSDNVFFNPQLQHHHQRRHPFTNNHRQYTSMNSYGDRMHSSNYMDMCESSWIPFGTMHPSTSRINTEYSREIQYESIHPTTGIDMGSSRAPAEYATGRGGTDNRGRR